MHLRNTFVFDNFGSDLMTVTNGWRERPLTLPIFGKLVFRIGDPDSIECGAMTTTAFTNVLKRLSRTLQTNHLTLVVELYSFVSAQQFVSFVVALTKIKVYKQLNLWVNTMSGPVDPVDMVDGITQAIGLPYVPNITTVREHNPSGIRISLHTVVPPLHIYCP